MPESESKSAIVLELAEEFLERYRQGERPSLKEYVDQHPNLAAEIHEVFPAMAMMENIALADESLAGADVSGRGATLLESAPLEQLGDYRILRKVGQGGMGIVYEAEQVSLGRHFALKVLPQKLMLDAKQKQRFEREARAAARLHHTNIVPVFGVGEHDGMPYYVMQFIQGLGLDEVLDELKRMQAGGAATASFTAGELRVSRKDVSVAEVARSLMTGEFRGAHVASELDAPEEALATATVDRSPNPLPEKAPSATHRSGGRLSDTFTPSSSSVILPGQSKDRRKARTRPQTYWQSIATLGVQVADALDYAHKQGILHRDIKPSNLLLDTSGTVWVTDFGLAKADDQQNLTHTGDLLGTLRYMPPEAFDGRSDARGDIYSLGLTLYEMLAFQPAFNEKERPKLIKQVTSTLPPRLAKLNSGVPRDLETIVHKAIDHDPGHRYQTAGELLTDLQRFLDDEPILARRTSTRERFWRWCRRNPFIASAAAAVILVFLLAFAVVSVALWDARRARMLAESRRIDAERNEQDARFQKEQAEQGFAQARKAVDDYLNQVTESDALKAAGLQPLRRDLLSSALKFYDSFVAERRDDQALRAELAAVHLRVAKIQRELGNDAARTKAAKEAILLFQALGKDPPGDRTPQVGLIEAFTQADEPAKAIALGEGVIVTHPDDLTAKVQLADAYYALAINRDLANDLLGALQADERGLQLRETLFARDPANIDYELGLAVALNSIGATLSRIHRVSDALVLYRRGLEHARNVAARRPRDYQTLRLLLRGLRNSSSHEEQLGLREQALKTNLEALELTQKLVTSDPEVPEYVLFLTLLALERARWLQFLGRKNEEMVPLRLAIEMSQSKLQVNYASVTSDLWIQYALAATRAAELLAERIKELSESERAEQERFAKTAVKHLRQGLRTGFQNVAFFKKSPALNYLRSRADFKDILACLEKDSRSFTHANKVAEAPDSALLKTSPEGSKPTTPTVEKKSIQSRADLAASRYASGMAELRFGRFEKADKSLTEARTELEAMIRNEPTNLRHRLELGRTHIALGDLRRDTRMYPEALLEWLVGRDLLLGVIGAVSAGDAVSAEAAALLTSLAAPWLTYYIRSEADPCYAASQGTSYDALVWTILQRGLDCLMVKDYEGYHRACEKIMKGFPNKEDWNGWYSADAAMLCAIDRRSKIDVKRYIPLAELGVQLADADTKQYRNTYAALTDYRAGKLDKVLERLDLCDRIANFGVKGFDDHTTLARAIRALVLHRLGRREEAQKALETARAWQPILENRRLIRTIRPVIQQGFPNEVVVDLSRLVLREASLEIGGVAFPIDQWENVGQAWGELQFGRKDHARKALERIGPFDPKDADLMAARGYVFSHLGDKNRAKADRDSALKINPDQVLARIDRAQLALAEGRPEAAADDLVAVLGKLPNIRTLEADRFIVDAMLASSEKAFKRAVQLRPTDQQLWIARGRYLAWKERWKEAAEAFGRGVEGQSIFHDWLEYGCVMVLAGDLDGYRRLCKRLEDRLKSPAGRKGVWEESVTLGIGVRLANLHPDSGIDSKKIREWINESLKVQVNNNWVAFAAGVTGVRMGRADEATVSFARSMRIDPLWAARELNWYGLALAHGLRGQTEEARHWFDQGEETMKMKLHFAEQDNTVPADYAVHDLLEAKVLRREVSKMLGSSVVAAKSGEASEPDGAKRPAKAGKE